MLSKVVEDKTLARYVRNEDPAVLWDELHRACAGNITTRHAVLKRKLFGLRFPESAPMATNFNTINELLNNLAAVNVVLTDDELQGVVLMLFPLAGRLAGRENVPIHE